MINEIISAVKEAEKTSESVNVIEKIKVNEHSKIEKTILEPNIEIAMNKTLESVEQMNIENGIEKITTRNQDLQGKEHPDTGITFEVKIVENSEGDLIEGVFAKFESIYDVELPEEFLESNDNIQFKECNFQLKEAVEDNPELAEKMTDEQLEQIKDGETPDGFTWHHDAEKGNMQLVDSAVHAKTGHTGGKFIWGGGNTNR